MGQLDMRFKRLRDLSFGCGLITSCLFVVLHSFHEILQMLFQLIDNQLLSLIGRHDVILFQQKTEQRPEGDRQIKRFAMRVLPEDILQILDDAIAKILLKQIRKPFIPKLFNRQQMTELHGEIIFRPIEEHV